MKRLLTFLNSLTLFFVPTQLAYHYWPQFSFIYGIRVDYLAVTIYLVDVLIIASLFFAFLQNKQKNFKYLKNIYPLVLFAVFNTLFSISFWVTLVRWLKIFLYIAYGFYIYNNKNKIFNKLNLNLLFVQLVLVSVLGILQVVNMGSLNGLAYFFGERFFNSQTPGIALQDYFGRIYLRPYSIFSHPNSLAGYVGLMLLFLSYLKYKFNDFIKIVGLIVVLVNLFLAFSVSVFVGLFFAFVIKKRIGKFVVLIIALSILVPWVLSTVGYQGLPSSISERVYLMDYALHISKNNLLLGSGLNTFVVDSYLYLILSSGSYLLQPVHNIYMLALSEIGVVGIFIFGYWINKTTSITRNITLNRIFVFIAVTSCFDHFWLTLNQNILLATVVMFSVLKFKKYDYRYLHGRWFKRKSR